MSYKDEQDFYVCHRPDFRLDRWEGYAARWLYLDERGKKRERKPDINRTVIKRTADHLVDEHLTKLGRDEMFRTLERALGDVQRKIRERVAIRADEIRRRVGPEYSLAISQLDLVVIRLLRSAQLFSRLDVGRATAEQITRISGINQSRYVQIRKVCPKVSVSGRLTKSAKRNQALVAGQGSLF